MQASVIHDMLQKKVDTPSLPSKRQITCFLSSRKNRRKLKSYTARMDQFENQSHLQTHEQAETHASTSDTAPPSGQTVAVLLQHKNDKKDHSAEGSSVSESTQQESQENTNDIVTLYEIVDQQGQVVYQAAVDQNTQHGESSDFQAVTAQANMDLQNIEVVQIERSPNPEQDLGDIGALLLAACQQQQNE